jgi:hypothetical protein
MGYLERIGRPEAHGGYGGVGGEHWRVVFLSRIGREEVDVTPYFPETLSHIRACSSVLYPVAGITFSVLEPGGYIAPHNDRTSVFIHLHQCVVTPPECGLKVADMEISFQESMSYVFDPSFVHEAWNRSRHNRIHLILPVWHPETTLAERGALTEVFSVLRDLSEHSDVTGRRTPR